MSLPSPMSLEHCTMTSDDPMSSTINMSRYSSSSSSLSNSDSQALHFNTTRNKLENSTSTTIATTKNDPTISQCKSGVLLKKAKTHIKSHFGKYPTLDEILNDEAPHPYDLSSFVGFLSRNHCLETVEFTKDVDTYTEKFNSGKCSNNELYNMWRRIVDSYIRIDGIKELNLPCEVRTKLTAISLPRRNSMSSDSSGPNLSDDEETYPPAPPPETLHSAVELAKDMMKENAYLPFISSVRSSHNDSSSHHLLIHRHNTVRVPTSFSNSCGSPTSSSCTNIKSCFGGNNSNSTPCLRRDNSILEYDSDDFPLHIPEIYGSAPAKSMLLNGCPTFSHYKQATTCNWQKPSSWNMPTVSTVPTNNSGDSVISKSSSTDSLFVGDEEQNFNRGPMTPPESPHGFASSSYSDFSSTRSRSYSSTDGTTNTPLSNSSTNSNDCQNTTTTSQPKQPQSSAFSPSPSSSSSSAENNSAATGTTTNTNMCQLPTQPTTQINGFGPYRNHWRKMSKRLKWRRGSEKDQKSLPPTSTTTTGTLPTIQPNTITSSTSTSSPSATTATVN